MSFDSDRPPLASLNTRGWASWLAYGIRAYFRLVPMPPSFSQADAFPLAKLYIGVNRNDLAADLVDLQRDLPGLSQGRFAEATALIWAELDFDRIEHFKVGATVLAIARKGRFKEIVDVIPTAVPKLTRAARRPDLSCVAAELRPEMFATVVDLASGTPRSIVAVHALMEAQRSNPTLIFATGRAALTGLVRLCRTVPTEIEIWIALTAHTITEGGTSKGLFDSRLALTALEQACGRERLQKAVNRIRGLTTYNFGDLNDYVGLESWLAAEAFASVIYPLPTPSKVVPIRVVAAGERLSQSDMKRVLRVG